MGQKIKNQTTEGEKATKGQDRVRHRSKVKSEKNKKKGGGGGGKT